MKHVTASQIIENRIANGDYSVDGLPPERELAVEVGVSRVTVRNALSLLHDKALIERGENRRFVLTEKALENAGIAQVALVVPAVVGKSFSLDLQRWQAHVVDAVRTANARCRIVQYHHWDDPVIIRTLRSYEGVFLVTSSEPIPDRIKSVIKNSAGLVSLSDDLTDLGIPSLVMYPPRCVDTLLDHLRGLGHVRISCFNVQGHNLATAARLERWRAWIQANSLDGEMFDFPCDTEANIFDFALNVATREIERIGQSSSAVFCTTLPAALGICRAAADANIRIGQDLSVCVVDAEGLAGHLVPSLTSLKHPETNQYITSYIQWIARGAPAEEWEDSMLVEPRHLELFDGESTSRPT